jgi:hypothetical protein
VEERIKRLEIVLWHIENSERYEYDFDKLYNLLTDEYHLEGGKDAPYVMNNYRHNLEQTMDKQSEVYKAMFKKRPKKGAPDEYRYFVNAFKQDVSDELDRCKYIFNSSGRS